MWLFWSCALVASTGACLVAIALNLDFREPLPAVAPVEDRRQTPAYFRWQAKALERQRSLGWSSFGFLAANLYWLLVMVMMCAQSIDRVTPTGLPVRLLTPRPTRRSAQVRLSLPHAIVVGANEPSAKRL